LQDSHITSYSHDGTLLKGLSEANVPGLEVNSGSLGQGLSVAVGLAMAALRRKTSQRCFAVVGDGEMNEGAIWEALMFAAHFHLSNLIVIVDANGYQAMGATQDVLGPLDLAGKLSAFGFETREADGHDEMALDGALAELVRHPGARPCALVAHTIKGRGVSFMENDNRWHYLRLTPEMYVAAMQELSQAPTSTTIRPPVPCA
jgi:transketolase